MVRFFIRFTIFACLSLVSNVCLFVIMFCFYWFAPKYKDSVRDYLECKVGQNIARGAFGLDPDNPNYPECTRNSGTDVPAQWMYAGIPLSALIVSMAALALSFNDENIAMWKRKFGLVTEVCVHDIYKNTKSISVNIEHRCHAK